VNFRIGSMPCDHLDSRRLPVEVIRSREVDQSTIYFLDIFETLECLVGDFLVCIRVILRRQFGVNELGRIFSRWYELPKLGDQSPLHVLLAVNHPDVAKKLGKSLPPQLVFDIFPPRSIAILVFDRLRTDDFGLENIGGRQIEIS
jgi:hypothetical protein